MKLILTSLLFSVSSFVFAALLQIHGNYKGDNLFVRNPYIDSLNKYSITSIILNEKKIEVDLQHLTVEIHFEKENIPLNAEVDIRIYYTPNFKPEVVNLSAIKRKTLFAFSNISIDEHHVKLMTRGEEKESSIIVERFENDEWIPIITHQANGGRTTNYYDLPIEHLSGTTKLRIVYSQQDGFKEYSKEISHKSSKTPINFYPAKVKDKITFLNNNKQPVKYVIYDINGKEVSSGKSAQIDCTGLTVKEVYTLSFDNQKKVFQKVKNK